MYATNEVLYLFSFTVEGKCILILWKEWTWRNTRMTNANKCKKKKKEKKSHVQFLQFSSWVRRGCWADTLDLRSDCSFWHHANFKTQFLKPGTILLLGVIQAAAIRHGEGAWLAIPDLFIVCCLPPCCIADGICMRYWLQKQICLQLRQSFASCQYVCCTHGENWAKLWERSDSVHVPIKPGITLSKNVSF